jgi:hypothetical protein
LKWRRSFPANDKNIHAHLLITERPFTPDGKNFSTKKAKDLNSEIRGSQHTAFGGLEWAKLWTQIPERLL